MNQKVIQESSAESEFYAIGAARGFAVKNVMQESLDCEKPGDTGEDDDQNELRCSESMLHRGGCGREHRVDDVQKALAALLLWSALVGAIGRQGWDRDVVVHDEGVYGETWNLYRLHLACGDDGDARVARLHLACGDDGDARVALRQWLAVCDAGNPRCEASKE